MLRNSFAYNPQSNGGAKKVVQDVIDLMRRMLPGLSAKLRGRVDLTLLWAMWLSGTQRSCSLGPRWGTTA